MDNVERIENKQHIYDDANLFKIKYCGNEYVCCFKESKYVNNNNTAIVIENQEPDGIWGIFGMLTVNLDVELERDQAFLDVNNMPDVVDFVILNDYADVIGDRRSGYVVYPLVQFKKKLFSELLSY